MRVTTDGCTDAETGRPVPGDDGGPYREVHDVQMVRAAGGDWALSRFAPEMLDNQSVTLKLAGGGARGLALDDPGATDYLYYPATSRGSR